MVETATSADVDVPPIERFREEARAWLAGHAAPRKRAMTSGWGAGSDRLPVFHNLTTDEERRLIDELRAWRRLRFDAGFGPISWGSEYGGRGYPPAYEFAFAEEEANFDTPATHEAIGITTGLIAPTIRAWGTPEQQEQFIRPMLRTDVIWCQLFSEPEAGSDLGSLRTRAHLDGDEWVINGQKVWTSGAMHADWGYLLARTEPEEPKHKSLTAFLIPMHAPGVEVRPLRQMSGGSSFSEVFFSEVRVPDGNRLGGRGEGWRVAMTTLGFERVTGAGDANELLLRFARAVDLAKHVNRAGDPLVRQQLSAIYIHGRLLELNNERVRQALRRGATPGPEGSIVKLFYGQGLARITGLVCDLLGPRLVADTGEWGTFAWAEHVTGAPGTRIAGGTDEIQRNVIGERVLGLPREPRPPAP